MIRANAAERFEVSQSPLEHCSALIRQVNRNFGKPSNTRSSIDLISSQKSEASGLNPGAYFLY